MRTAWRPGSGCSSSTSIETRELRPFAGVVDEIADHLLEVLPFAAELRARAARSTSIARSLSWWVFSMVRRDRVHHRHHIGDGADHRDARRDPRALQMARHLLAHDADLLGAPSPASGSSGRAAGLVHHHRERRLQRMREIADMGAGALDDLAVGVEQRVGLARERLDLDRKLAFELARPCRSGCRQAPREMRLERREAEPHLEQRGEQQHQRPAPKKVMAMARLNAVISSSISAASPATATEEAAVVAEVDIARSTRRSR